MSGIDIPTDHPVDALPDFVRGRATEASAIERHLELCETCRAEVEILRALRDSNPDAMSDLERKRVYRAFQTRRADSGSGPASGTSPTFDRVTGRPGPRWLRITWRAAAAIAVLLTSVGVWQVVQRAPGASGWSPEMALEEWGRDLAELDADPGAVLEAFGLAFVDEIPWEELDGVDPFDLEAPWEENR